MLKKINKKYHKLILDQLKSHINKDQFEFHMDFNIDHISITVQDFKFYDDFKFLEITQYDTHPARILNLLCRVTGDDYKNISDIHMMDWTNGPIYRVNKMAPISLTKDNIQDYARFFFGYVRGRHGRFHLIDNIEDIHWQEDPPPAARLAVSKMISPLEYIGCDEDGVFHMRACLMFQDSLFKSRISITAQGDIDLSEEELMIEDMPVFDDVLGQ